MLEAFFRFVYWVPFRAIIQIIPLEFGQKFAVMAGSILNAISLSKRKKLSTGIRFLGYSEDKEKKIRKGVFQNLTLNGIEVFHFPKFNRYKMLNLVKYEGLDNLDKALKEKKGVILMHGHFGNEEMLMPAMGYLGYKVNQIATRWEPGKKANSFISEVLHRINRYAYKKKISYRERLPVNFIYVDRFLRDIYRLLNRNEVLLLAADGREGHKWIEIEFMGKKVLYSEGPVKIAMKSKAAVLPTFIVRQPDNSHKVIIHGPLKLKTNENIKENIGYNIKIFVQLLEKYATKYPEQYLKVFLIDKPLFKED